MCCRSARLRPNPLALDLGLGYRFSRALRRSISYKPGVNHVRLTLEDALTEQHRRWSSPLDGVGLGPRDAGDAVHLARTPNLDRLWASDATRTLRAHGTAVGLPNDSDMGNSEVGHNALGAGRVVRQGASLVNDAFDTGALFEGDTWRWLVDDLGPDGTLHLCGLLSDGNVHAHINHVRALIAGAAAAGVRRLRVHALADGRDVEDPSYERYLTELDAALGAHHGGERDFRPPSRRPHGGHHGPLRGRLAHRGARLAGARPR